MEHAASVTQETERVKAVQDKHASGYDRQIAFFERILFGDGRAWVCSQAQGRVLELAAGTVRNLPFYPQSIELTAIELSPEMVAIGRQRAAKLGHPVDLRLGDAQALEFEDGSFDTVTCTLGFCTIPDTTTAAREAFRVMRPGGRLLMLEHVRSPVLPVRAGQRLLAPSSVQAALGYRRPRPPVPGPRHRLRGPRGTGRCTLPIRAVVLGARLAVVPRDDRRDHALRRARRVPVAGARECLHPRPSEVTLLFSGFAVHQGWMSFPLAALAATAATSSARCSRTASAQAGYSSVCRAREW
jgi:ubiquinone/menaquinone biosynthesis C-methylase UbiE